MLASSLSIQGVQAQISATAPACAQWINIDPANRGDVVWGNLAGAQCDADENRVFSANASGQHYTQGLVFNNFGLHVPADANITGIEVILVRRSANGVGVSDRTVQLMRGGQLTGSNLHEPGIWERDWSGAFYGGAKDTWGSKWTPAELNASGFGLFFDANMQGGDDRVEIDQVLVTVYYIPTGTAIRSSSTATTSKHICSTLGTRP